MSELLGESIFKRGDKTAIMQPYIFPYIGYFNLIHATDNFVFYDDVNFVKKSWINRNRILSNGHVKTINFPVLKASQNRAINEIGVDTSIKEYKKLISNIEHSYKKAKMYEQVMPMINSVLTSKYDNIAELAISSIETVSSYLGLESTFYKSSKFSPESKGKYRSDRLIEITKKLDSVDYVNSFGGQELYTKEYFKNNGVNLEFVNPIILKYDQISSNSFEGHLSIIDLIMNLDKSSIQTYLKSYSLI